MRAVHEHEAFPFLSALEDHDTPGPTVAHADDVLKALTLAERSWEEPDTAGTPLEEAPTSERGLNAADPETDPALAQYFGEVRHFALLSFAEEQALGRRITRWQRRVRWALYTASTALPTLRRLWHLVAHQEIPVHEVVQPQEGRLADPAAQRVQLQQALVHLQELAVQLRGLEVHHGSSPWAAPERRGGCPTRVPPWAARVVGWENPPGGAQGR